MGGRGGGGIQYIPKIELSSGRDFLFNRGGRIFSTSSDGLDDALKYGLLNRQLGLSGGLSSLGNVVPQPPQWYSQPVPLLLLDVKVRRCNDQLLNNGTAAFKKKNVLNSQMIMNIDSFKYVPKEEKNYKIFVSLATLDSE